MTDAGEARTTFLSNLGIETPLGGDPLRGMMQALIEADAARTIGVGRYERTEERQALRNGWRAIAPQQTRMGTIELTVPKLRTGMYYPEFLSPRRPWEQAVVLTAGSLEADLLDERRRAAEPRDPATQ
jgi:transposase-like protein